MYTVMITGSFSAMHRVEMPDGALEPPHGHDWSVQAFFSSAELDGHGMVVDFCQAKEALDSVLQAWHHRNLNEEPAFAGTTPTAERVARHIFEQLVDAGFRQTQRVEVTEAPGCRAMYERNTGSMPETRPN
jgi:6-pyruvoyltetrahydropterin/6-carboxytetrahydropterin synthase